MENKAHKAEMGGILVASFLYVVLKVEELTSGRLVKLLLLGISGQCISYSKPCVYSIPKLLCRWSFLLLSFLFGFFLSMGLNFVQFLQWEAHSLLSLWSVCICAEVSLWSR